MLPSLRDTVFSAKTFAAAMLALYIAFYFGLPRPYWALATVYIVSNPFVGATRSKALYRAIGTVLGASGAVLLVPPLVDMPLLLSAVIALWIGVFLYFAITTRTARAYVFTLASYTLPIVAFAAVDSPGSVFDIAVSRVEEILIGIVCSSVIGSVVFPSPLAPTIDRRNETWFSSAVKYALKTLAGDVSGDDVAGYRRELAMHVRGLELLLSQLTYDHASPRTLHLSDALYGRMQLLMPVMSSLGDVMAAWHEDVKVRSASYAVVVEQVGDSGGAISSRARVLDLLLADIGAWFTASLGKHAPQKDTNALLARITSLQTQKHELAATAWSDALFMHLLRRLTDVVEVWEDCTTVRSLITDITGNRNWRSRYRHWQIHIGRHIYIDHVMSLVSAGTAAIVLFISTCIWIFTGWNDGALAVSLGAVGSGLFVAADNPGAMIMTFFLGSCGAVALAAAYTFLILPNVSDFPLLALFFAFAFIPLGLFIAKPKVALITTLIAFMTALTLSINGNYNDNSLTFFNSNLATAAGILFSAVLTAAVRPFGTRLARDRLLRSSWRDVLASTLSLSVRHQRQLHGRMLDRLIQLIARTPTANHPGYSALDSLRDMRIALNTAALRRQATKGEAHVAELIEEILGGVKENFSACLAVNARVAASVPLKSLIERAVEQVTTASLAEMTLKERTDILHSLMGLHISLYAKGAYAVSGTE